MSVFLCLSRISMGRYSQEAGSQKRGVRKKIKRGNDHIRVVAHRSMGLKPSAHYYIFHISGGLKIKNSVKELLRFGRQELRNESLDVPFFL